MQDRIKYYVSAVQNDRVIEDSFIASSEKQAWFKFGSKYGFNVYGFTVLGTEVIREQLKFNI